jgi:SAM-dependent methyltransferase
MPDPAFSDPRLAPLYDVFEGRRDDLEVYVAVAAQFGAHRVLDVGCGTGSFALLLAQRGFEVIGVDPAEASLAVAMQKPGAAAVRWLHGEASAVPPLGVDLATMTGNVAQAITDDDSWRETLRAIHGALRPGGFLVFESRDPTDRPWEEWTAAATHQVVEATGAGSVQRWTEVTNVALPLVTFKTTFVFAQDGSVVTSDSTLRFRHRHEIECDLTRHGYELVDVRGAPDRPGRQFVFITRRPSEAAIAAVGRGLTTAFRV